VNSCDPSYQGDDEMSSDGFHMIKVARFELMVNLMGLFCRPTFVLCLVLKKAKENIGERKNKDFVLGQGRMIVCRKPNRRPEKMVKDVNFWRL